MSARIRRLIRMSQIVAANKKADREREGKLATTNFDALYNGNLEQRMKILKKGQARGD